MSGRSSTVSVVLWVLTAALLCGNSPSRAEQAPAKKAPRATSPEVAVRQALAKPVELKFVETPLAGVAKSLEKTLGIPVRFDRKALDDVGIGGDVPVTFKVSDISARSALELILRQLDLTWVIGPKALLITTPEEAETRLEKKVYDIANQFVRGSGSAKFDFDSLTDVITACIQPTSWSQVGGPASIDVGLDLAGPKVLVISQTRQGHEEIEALLADLLGARREKPGKSHAGQKQQKAGKAPPAKDRKAPSPEEAIHRSLSKPVKLDFKKTPLDDVVEYLNQKAGIQTIIDRKALDDAGVGINTPLTVHVAGVKLRSALDSMLRPLDLTWTIAHEVLLITTPEEAETMLRAKVYDVSDLPAHRNQQDGRTRDYDWLIEMITTGVQPLSWDAVGGPGSIAPFQAAGIQVLVVSQTREVREDVEALLAKLRKGRAKRALN